MKKNRQRYLLFEIFSSSNSSIDEKTVIRAIWQKLIQIYGEIISFKAGLWLTRWDPIHKIGILRYEHLTSQELIASLAFIHDLNGNPVIFHTRKSSGTIKKTLAIWKKNFPTPPPKKQK